MRALLIIVSAFLLSCQTSIKGDSSELFVVLLGIAQDAGSPQIGCQKDCCKDLWANPQQHQKVISLGIVDKKNNEVWILDATPDFKSQLHDLLSYLPDGNIKSVRGIFLTHAHTGHYTGLMELGREAMGAKDVPVYAMPGMANYLENNGPWQQLVELNNIKINQLSADSTIRLSEDLQLSAFLVPHRDEYSETVGYRIDSKTRSLIFIPDIDKWHKWDRDIKSLVNSTNYAFLDGAFYAEDELPNRNMSEIPHPYVPETMKIFEASDEQTKNKVIFIHLNHTNKLLKDGPEYETVTSQGFRVGREGQVFSLE